jgi:beta-lactamase class A
MNNRRIVFFIMVFVFGIAIGGVGTYIFNLNHGLLRSAAVRQTGYTLTNPLLECEISDQEFSWEIRSFREKLQAVVDHDIQLGKARHVSVYFRDLNNGPWIGLNEKELFSPSSLLKVPLMMAVFQMAEKNPVLLEEELLYSGADVDTVQNVMPTTRLVLGTKYSYESLIERMITSSDNNAALLVSQSIPEHAYLKPYEELGLPLPLLSNGEYYLRVKDYATFFRVLYNASYLTREHSEKALSYLLKSEFTDGLVAGVPTTIAVAHKFGERMWEDTQEHQMHDCGIIYYPGYPYLLCVMTRGDDFDSLKQTISGISTFVYEEITSQMTHKKK